MRVALTCLLALLAAPAWGGEPAASPAPQAETHAAPALAVQRIELPRPATALAPGRTDDEIVVATDDGALLRAVIGQGVTARTPRDGARIEELAVAPRGEVVAVATLTELEAVDTEAGASLWKAPRPVAFAFDAQGRRLLTVTENGEVVEIGATTGQELARRRIAEKRAVVRASLHAASGLAVLGVADG